MLTVALPAVKLTTPLYILSACGASTNECDKHLLADHAGRGCLILKQPEAFDNSPPTHTPPVVCIEPLPAHEPHEPTHKA